MSMASENRWRHHGLWGAVRDGESAVLADTRRAVESGRLPRKANQQQTMLVRSYELARRLGLKGEAEGIEHKMAMNTENEHRRTARRPIRSGDLLVRRYVVRGEQVVEVSHVREER